MSSIHPSLVRSRLHYEAETGEFARAVTKRCGKNNAVVRYLAGDKAGTKNLKGYVQIAVDGRLYYAHRLAFAYMTGEWPTGQVDHINGIRDDNRWSNLRSVTSQVNQQNLRKAQTNNKSGLLGVSTSRHGKFEARITSNRVSTRIGRFDDPEAAHEAYLLAKRKLHVGCTI